MYVIIKSMNRIIFVKLLNNVLKMVVFKIFLGVYEIFLKFKNVFIYCYF